MRGIRQMSLEGTSPSMTRALGRSLPAASRISRSVVAAAGEQPDPAVLLADDQAIPVMLDLVNPVGSDRRSARRGRDAGFDEARGLPLGG